MKTSRFLLNAEGSLDTLEKVGESEDPKGMVLL